MTARRCSSGWASSTASSLACGASFAVQPLEVRMPERDVDRPHPVGPLGVAFGRYVFQKDRVFVKAGAHADTLIACAQS